MAADPLLRRMWGPGSRLRSRSGPNADGLGDPDRARLWAGVPATLPSAAATFALAAALVSAASAGGDAAEFPTGTFTGSRQPDWAITFEDGGRFTVASAGSLVAAGAWQATETNVSLSDEPVAEADEGKPKTGRYTWRHEWGTLTFALVHDDSEGRGILLTENDWIDSRVLEIAKWVSTYYCNPAPDQVVDKVRQMSELGVLRATGKRGRPDANVMFLGKVMQANPGKIADWMEQLASLPASEQETLRKAVWYSDCEAGRAWLVEHGAGDVATGPRPILFGGQEGFLLTSGDRAVEFQPHHLDQLWEWFFATGEAEPVVRITEVFGLAYAMPTSGSRDLLPPPPETDDKVQASLMASNYRLVRQALWSTTSLAIRHDRVLSILVEQQQTAGTDRVKAWIDWVIEIARADREAKGQSGAD